MFHFFIFNVSTDVPPNYLRVEIQIGKIFNFVILLSTHILSKKNSFMTCLHFLFTVFTISLFHTKKILFLILSKSRKKQCRVRNRNTALLSADLSSNIIKKKPAHTSFYRLQPCNFFE